MTRGSAAILGLLALCGSAGLAQPTAEPELTVQLRPVQEVASQTIGQVDVQLRIGVLEGEAPRLRLPFVVNNVETVADALADVRASDSAGALPLLAGREGEGDAAARVWTFGRAAKGPVSISYGAPVGLKSATRGAAPPLELRNDDSTFSGAGSTFLILPESDRPYRLRVEWDLAALPSGTIGVSSLGPGDASSASPQPPSVLQRSFFMAGKVDRHPALPSDQPFLGVWQGEPPFDARALMAWTEKLHGRFTQFFRLAEPQRYTVFMRPNPVNAGGGVGLASSFVTTFDGNTDGEELKLTLAHEMFHTFAPSISQPAGLASSWFSEGLAVHYMRVLPLRFGMISPGDFLESLNSTAARYYTSAMAEVPNAEIPGHFWEDTRIRTLPYDRGGLYFADLNHRLKQHSGGCRSLDDLLLEMAALQRSGRSLGNADWEALLERELGEAGVKHFRQMLAGRPPLPASDAFGPCFRRTTRTLRRYELGFDPKVLVEPRRIVRGLVPGSAAEKAGIRNGDEIVKPVPQDRIQGDQEALFHLEIRRDGRVFSISYLPRGETVEAYQWERVQGRPDEACAI